MEPITHSQHARRKRNSPKINLVVSVVLHAVILGAGFFWAAREGVLGEKMKTITADILEKTKKVEAKKPDAKTQEAKQEEVKKIVAEAKAVKAAVAAAGPATAPPPPPAALTEAPPPAVISEMNFGNVVTTDPVLSYKNQVETAFRAKWNRPTDIDDTEFVAEVELSLDATGKLLGFDWKKGSGNARWDDSVRQALATTKAVNRPPPKGFPEKFLVRFDVEMEKTEPLLSATAP